jgi:hypothetical protein
VPERYKTTVMFEKDELVTIKIPFTANPLPKAVWSKGNEEIKPSDTYQVEITNHFVTLKIKKTSNTLSGTYRLVLSNSLGSDDCEIKILIAGNADRLFFFYSLKHFVKLKFLFLKTCLNHQDFW